MWHKIELTGICVTFRNVCQISDIGVIEQVWSDTWFM